MSNCVEIANSFMTGQAKTSKFNLDLSKIEYIEFEDLDYRHHCDGNMSAGMYEGRSLTDEELDYINMNEPMFVREALENYLW